MSLRSLAGGVELVAEVPVEGIGVDVLWRRVNRSAVQRFRKWFPYHSSTPSGLPPEEVEVGRPSRWNTGRPPSADSIGRICSLMNPADMRAAFHQVYSRLKRMKALEPPGHGLMLAVVDGHETTASRKRCCPECGQRTLHTARGDVLEYYHRYAILRWVGGTPSLMLDAEPIHPGEDELAASRRLVERLLVMYPRAFDVVAGDALYANTEWFRVLL